MAEWPYKPCPLTNINFETNKLTSVMSMYVSIVYQYSSYIDVNMFMLLKGYVYGYLTIC